MSGDELDSTYALPGPVALASVAASAVEVGSQQTLFSDPSNGDLVSTKKRDGSTVSYTGFVSGVQDLGKRELRWTQDNGDNNSIYLMRVQPSEVAAPPFVFGTGCFVFDGARRDQVMSWGWNMRPGNGGLVVAGEPALGVSIESDWSPDASTNDYMEYIISARTSAGVERRPFSYTFNRTTGDLAGSITGEGIVISRESGGVQSLWIRNDLSPVTYTLGRNGQLTVVLRNENNDVAFLEQLNAAQNAWLEVIRLNSSNQVELGRGGSATKIAGNVGFNNTAPAAKPTITGSRGGNAALADLLTKLAATGLITDGTSA